MKSRYVDNKELKRIIEDGKLEISRIKSILKEQGIIFVSTHPKLIAEQVYPIFWGCEDIELLSQSIDDKNNYLKSSLIEIRFEDSKHILEDLEDCFENIFVDSEKIKILGIQRVETKRLIVKLQYSTVRPGRNELISTQKKIIDIFVTTKDNEKALMDIRQVSRTEMKEINKIFEIAMQENDKLQIKHMSLFGLKPDNRIAFFDEFSRRNFKGWNLDTVTKVELKKYIDLDTEMKILDEDEVSSLEDLNGITSAILNGTSIRNNSFVEDCLKNDFYIVTMGFKFKSKEEAQAVVVEVNLKYDDLKIDICKTFEYDSDKEKMCVHPALLHVQEEMLKIFQQEAYIQYIEILKRQNEELKSL